MLGADYAQQDCALARALEVVGERWTLLIIRDAFYGVQRFNDFQTHLDIPRGVLAERLAGLVENGILARRPDPRHRGRHIYRLTSAGKDLWPAISALMAWGIRHRKPNSRVFKHAVCSTTLDTRGWCRTCDLTPGPEDIVTQLRLRPDSRSREDPVAVALRTPHRLLEPLDTTVRSHPPKEAA